MDTVGVGADRRTGPANQWAVGGDPWCSRRARAFQGMAAGGIVGAGVAGHPYLYDFTSFSLSSSLLLHISICIYVYIYVVARFEHLLQEPPSILDGLPCLPSPPSCRGRWQHRLLPPQPRPPSAQRPRPVSWRDPTRSLMTRRILSSSSLSR